VGGGVSATGWASGGSDLRPAHGQRRRILHDGQDITHLTTRELRRRGLSYVPPTAAPRFQHGFSVMENMIIATTTAS